MPSDLSARFEAAVQSFWATRDAQSDKQAAGGKPDAGSRGSVTAGEHMNGLVHLVVDILKGAGIEDCCIQTKAHLALPGYFRPEKKWDLIVVKHTQLLFAIELKSQVGSVAKNLNNRAEEAIGSAVDLWTAYREGRFGQGAPAPFLGYFFLLEDCEEVHKPVKSMEPHFAVDRVFKGASYSQRYECLCRRLVLERKYSAACLTLATNGTPARISHPCEDLSFGRFVAELRGAAARFAEIGNPSTPA